MGYAANSKASSTRATTVPLTVPTTNIAPAATKNVTAG